VTTLDELTIREQAAQDKLQALGEEKRLMEQELASTQKNLTERDYYSSEVISSTVAHVVALLKSYMPNIDPELIHKEYQCKDDDERDALIEGVFDAAKHFIFEYDFSVANNQDSPGA
jgi:hypothetical protein